MITDAPTRTTPPSVGSVALFWGGYLAILLLASQLKPMVPASLGQLTWGLVSSLLILALTLALLRREGRAAADVGLGLRIATAPRFFAGATIGLAVYGLTVLAVSALVGPLRFVPAATPGAGAIALVLGTTLSLAAMEELGFRGYPLRTLVPLLGHWPAQLVVALAFGLSHLAFGWPWQTVLLGVVPNALLFGVAATASRGLALPLGLHAVLNLARWAAGETDRPGLWTVAVAEANHGRVSSWAPMIAIATVGLFVAALSRFRLAREAGGG